MKANNHYNFKSDFETMREIQDFERENISMSWPTFDSTPIGKNTTNRTPSPIYSITVKRKNRAYATDITNVIFRAKWKSEEKESLTQKI